MSTTNTFSLKFVARKERVDENGRFPIYARVHINGRKLEISTNLKTDSSSWLAKQQTLKADTQENRQINGMLQGFKSKIYQAYSNVVVSGKELTSEFRISAGRKNRMSFS